MNGINPALFIIQTSQDNKPEFQTHSPGDVCRKRACVCALEISGSCACTCQRVRASLHA